MTRRILAGVALATLPILAACSDATGPGAHPWKGSYALSSIGGSAMPATIHDEQTEHGRYVVQVDSGRIDILTGSAGEVAFAISSKLIQDGHEMLSQSYWRVPAALLDLGDRLVVTYGSATWQGFVTDTILPSRSELRLSSFGGVRGVGEFVFTRR